MQTNFFSSLLSFNAQTAAKAPADVAQRLSGPVELDLATLAHVGGGLMGPAGTWSPDSAVAGPAGTW